MLNHTVYSYWLTHKLDRERALHAHLQRLHGADWEAEVFRSADLQPKVSPLMVSSPILRSNAQHAPFSPIAVEPQATLVAPIPEAPTASTSTASSSPSKKLPFDAATLMAHLNSVQLLVRNHCILCTHMLNAVFAGPEHGTTLDRVRDGSRGAGSESQLGACSVSGKSEAGVSCVTCHCGFVSIKSCPTPLDALLVALLAPLLQFHLAYDMCGRIYKAKRSVAAFS